ncbi:phage tail assembly chaperone [Xanthobacteraceae bacterium Astr-EGSB]|uniref:phage tail assembly chaperone n=1 Tax=Astrobacterium formosum TaxID=3069710 RepID=UPI0027AEDC66|nr:phage tail assembly chaperone [Xanthobacteraceae bacterium Astr-EGSB]
MQRSHGQQPFRRDGLEVAIIDTPPADQGGGYAVDPASLRPAVIDPVCDAIFDPRRDHRTFVYGGETYHFCCDNCFVRFVLDEAGAIAARAQRIADGAVKEGPWQCCEVVALPAPPPTVIEVKIARNQDLAATDVMMVTDRPMSDDLRTAWRTYRQTLRDLGAIDTASEMISAWPLRPDGRDAIIALRARNG